MSKNLRTEAVDHLFDAILCLENREECYTFFEDVCTINEILSLSQRFEVAKMLREQKTYLDIAEKTLGYSASGTVFVLYLWNSCKLWLFYANLLSAIPRPGTKKYGTKISF